ncbi:MAG: hypothetical protein GF344_11070, partial [Chitinivibrionales bacterium]|nr:hypothetical protein [Chitinivibrionales bacterium]MBD3357344.1 hypothetical protein [Chitinivibrionales bacterium]
GVEPVDYRFTDSTADPSGEEAYHTERLVRLDPCFLCYRPPDCAPSPRSMESGRNGMFTLGSFNALPKINARVIHLWSQILKAVPNSRLLLKNKALSDQTLRSSLKSAFVKMGIDRERIELLGYAASTREHLALYHEVDIALDTFPYNGTTTTCEALWMGVPVVTLAGGRHAGRVGASLLNAVGLAELVASDEEEYMQKTLSLAVDEARLKGLRTSMRAAMATSVLCNAKEFVSRIEVAYRRMWFAAYTRIEV